MLGTVCIDPTRGILLESIGCSVARSRVCHHRNSCARQTLEIDLQEQTLRHAGIGTGGFRAVRDAPHERKPLEPRSTADPIIMVDGMSDITSIMVCCSHLVVSIVLVKTKQIIGELVEEPPCSDARPDTFV